MYLSKPLFFTILVITVAAPFWTIRAIWVVRSVKVQGIYAFTGNGFAGDQVREDYSVISFRVGEKDIWFSGLGNLPYKPGAIVPIRYQPDNLYDARVDIFAGIWGDVTVYSGIPVFLLFVMFLHRRVMPWGSRIRLTTKRPFIQIITSKSFGNG